MNLAIACKPHEDISRNPVVFYVSMTGGSMASTACTFKYIYVWLHPGRLRHISPVMLPVLTGILPERLLMKNVGESTRSADVWTILALGKAARPSGSDGVTVGLYLDGYGEETRNLATSHDFCIRGNVHFCDKLLYLFENRDRGDHLMITYTNDLSARAELITP